MPLTPTQQQLQQVSLKKIMGKAGLDPEFDARLADLSVQIWSEYLSGEVLEFLTPDKAQSLQVLLNNESSTPEQVSGWLTQNIPNFEEEYLVYTLGKKAETIKGRIVYLLKQTKKNSAEEEILMEIGDLVDAGKWREVEENLSDEFGDQ
jgi:hypothetical protein